MKRMIQLFLVLCVLPLSAYGEPFETDRLPIGDSERKHDFCAVRLNGIFDTETDEEISFDALIEKLARNRIVMIGEAHTSQAHHDVQLDIIKGLVDAGKPVVMALEMFNPAQDDALAAWSSGKTDPETFMEQTGYLTTWSHNYRYYRAIFDYAREKQIPIYGANVERKYTKKIAGVGISGLTRAERSEIPEVDLTSADHRFFIKAALGGVDALMPERFDRMHQAQSLWDTAMGEGAMKAADRHPDATVVVLAGSGHVVYNLGIGRVIRNRSDLSFASVATVDVPDEAEDVGMMKVINETRKKKQEAAATTAAQMDNAPPNEGMIKAAESGKTPYRIVIRAYADYLLGRKEADHEKYPAFGFSLMDKEARGYPVKNVLPDSIAAENGIMPGDIIRRIDAKEFPALFDIKKHLQYKNWNEEISFDIIREDKPLTLSFIIKPVEEKE